MVNEDIILENQTQTLEEVLDKLNDRSTETIEQIVVGDADVASALDITVECFRALADLRRTISSEGVSNADVQALRNIQQRMQPYIRLPSCVALEAYEGTFTPSRSMINQTVSQEAALAEMGKTLKEWFFIFVDFIIRVVDWCRVVWNSEDLIRGRLKMMDSHLQSLHNEFQQLMKYNSTFGRDAMPEMLALAEVVLSDPKLTRSENMLVAFNVKGLDSVVKMADKDIDANFNRLMKDVVSLKGHIEADKPMAISYDYATEFNATVQALEDMTVAMDDKDYFITAVRTDFWTRPKLLVSRPIFAPSHNIEQVQRLAKEVRSIKRNSNFDALKEVDILVNTIENISNSVKVLERCIKYKQALYADYYKASATYANFYIRARDTLNETILTKSAADFDKSVMDRLDKVWESLLNKMGI